MMTQAQVIVMEHSPYSVRCKQCGRLMVPRVHHGYSNCPFCLSHHWDQERSGSEWKFFGLMLMFNSCLLIVALPALFPLGLLFMALGLWIMRKAELLKECSPGQALRLLFRR